MPSRWRSGTGIIAIITVAVSAMAMVGGLDYFIMLLGFIPARLSGLIELPGVPALLTPFTSTVVHGGWLHLGINMLMLMIVGPQVERVVGTGGLVAAYVAGAVAAAAAQYFVDPASNIPVIGASGAISALFGLYAIFFGAPKPFSQNVRLNRWIHIAWLLAAWVVIQLMIGALAGGQGMLLAIPAHIGGFVAGLALHRPLLLWRYRKA